MNSHLKLQLMAVLYYWLQIRYVSSAPILQMCAGKGYPDKRNTVRYKTYE